MAEASGGGVVLVAGATGVTGGMIVHKLLARGERVRALVREGSDYAALEKAGAEIALGDLKQALSLRKAMDGVGRVVSTATASSRHGGEDTVESVDRIGTASLIEAAREGGVQRFLFVSAWGFEGMSGPLARAKVESEKRLAESGVPFTILHPVFFMDVWIGWVVGGQIQNAGKVEVAGDKDAKYGFIAAENVADMAVAALGEPRAENAKIPLCAEVASFANVVKRIGKITGSSIPVEEVEPGEPVNGLPEVVIKLWSEFGEKDPPEPTGKIFEAYGVRPIQLDEFLERVFRPQTAGAA